MSADPAESCEACAVTPQQSSALHKARPQTAAQYTEHIFSANESLHPFIQAVKAQSLAALQANGNEPPVADADRLAAMPPAERSGLKSIEDFLAQDSQLFSMPDVFFQLILAMRSRSADASAIAHIIQRDTGLAANVLRLANSPVYRLPKAVDSVETAVALLGTKRLSGLAAGTLVIQRFLGLPAELIDMRSFWLQSLARSVFAEKLAGLAPGVPSERIFMASLLRDVGLLVMLDVDPHHVFYALHAVESCSLPFLTAEQSALGFDHCALGAKVLERWHLPPEIVELVAFAETPAEALDATSASIVHMAEILTTAMHYAMPCSRIVPKLNLHAWALLRPTQDDLLALTRDASPTVRNLCDSLLGSHG